MWEILAILLSPIIPILITLWWQRRKEKRDAKIRLFTTLMAFRKSYPVSYEWANALNLIDVIFSDSPKVVDRWHKYYDNLNDEHGAAARIHLYLELMSEMARELGFRQLQQTDIDKFYVPGVHGTQADLNAECQREWLRVLKNSARFETSPREPPDEGGGLSGLQIPTRQAPAAPRQSLPPPARE
jgi:hypothetical protein